MFAWNINKNKDRTYYICCETIHKYLLVSIFNNPLIKGITIQMFFSSLVKRKDLFLDQRFKKLFFSYLFFLYADKLPRIIYGKKDERTKQSINSFKIKITYKKLIDFIISILYFEGNSLKFSFDFERSSNSYFFTEEVPLNFFTKKIPSILSFLSFNDRHKLYLGFNCMFPKN